MRPSPGAWYEPRRLSIGKPSSARTRARTVLAISAGEPNRCVHPATSAKASSMEMRSMEGVKSLSTSMAASPSRWYSSKCPPTKTRPGQSWRARRPGMPLRTPKALASYEAASHDAAADRNRFALQARVEQLFDRRIKGVKVRVENGGCGTHLVASSPWPQCMTAYWTNVSQWVCAQASTAESVSVHRSIICQPRITPTTARTRVATRRVPVRRPGAAPLERQLQSSASAPSSIPVANRRMRG